MQYPKVETRNCRLAFKIIKRIFSLFASGALHLDENNSQSAIQSELLISSSFYAMLSESTPNDRTQC